MIDSFGKKIDCNSRCSLPEKIFEVFLKNTGFTSESRTNSDDFEIVIKFFGEFLYPFIDYS